MWRACEARLGATVEELHRDELPPGWGIARSDLPCVVAGTRGQRPFVLVSREELAACRGSAEALERRIVAALATAGQARG